MVRVRLRTRALVKGLLLRFNVKDLVKGFAKGLWFRTRALVKDLELRFSLKV